MPALTPGFPQPSAEGTFAQRPLPHLLVYAYDRKLSGTFEFLGPDGQDATVIFVDGHPTKVRSAEAIAYLGSVLVELGIIALEDLERFMQTVVGGTELHGQALLAAGIITEEQLELGLRAQVVRKMLALAHLPPETTFRYYDHFDALESYGGKGYSAVDPYPAVWACIRELPPWQHVERGLLVLSGAGFVLSASAQPERFAFDTVERAAVELARQKPIRLAELVAASKLDEPVVKLIVYCLLVTKQVDLIRESQFPPAPADDDWAESTAVGVPRFATLNVPWAAPIGDRASPPSAVAPVSSAAPPSSMAASPTSSSRYVIGSSSSTSSSTLVAVPSSRNPASEPSGELTPELIARKKEIEETATRIGNDDYYAVLGVPRDAPSTEIQRAFLSLAKRWHPDRVPAALRDVRPACSKVFARMSEAHQTLSNLDKRRAYDKAGRKRDDSPEDQALVVSILAAANEFEKAEFYLKRNELKLAEEHCRKAISVEPNQADYISLLAWVESLRPDKQDPASTARHIAEMTRAIGISPVCSRAVFYRAMLLKRSGQEAPALIDFKRVMELNPRNLDAQREVRLAAMRAEKADKGPPPTRRLSQLFKKQ